MTKRLSDRQEAILKAIGALMDRQPYPPSVREIQAEAGVSSVPVVAHNMRILERMGYLSLTPMIARGAVITEAGRRRIAPPGAKPLSRLICSQPSNLAILLEWSSPGECCAKIRVTS